MQWNVEMRLSPVEIEREGKEAALKRARLRAWLEAIHKTTPQRSITLLSEEEGERYMMPFLLLRFEVDPN